METKLIVKSPTSPSYPRHPHHVHVIPVESKKGEICSTFENVPNASPSCPRRCWGSFLNGNHIFVIGDVGVTQFVTWKLIIGDSNKMATQSSTVSNEQIMDVIQNLSCIYNKRSKDYNDQRMKQNAWKLIGDQLHFNAGKARSRYDVGRTRFSS